MGQPSSDRNLDFRPDLQGLRALAVILVILAHAGIPFFSGGFVGVDVFFVLSGYLITGLLLVELEQTCRIDVAAFYARRLKRLFPALTAMLVTAYAAAIGLLSPEEARQQLVSAPYAVTWTSNIHFALTSVDYFDELAAHDLYLHTWSLGVEEQFYLVWPLFLIGLFGLARSQLKMGGGIPKLLWAGLSLALLSSLALSIYWTHVLPNAAFYQMPSRIWQFALGSFVQLALRDRLTVVGPFVLSVSATSRFLTLSLGIALILGSGTWLTPNFTYPGAWALGPSLGAALVIAAGRSLTLAQGNVLSHPMLVWVGDRSYSLYLWHWPILILGFAHGLRGKALPIAGLLLMSLLAAMLSHRFVELPFWRGRFSGVPPRHSLLAGLLIMALLLFALDRIEVAPSARGHVPMADISEQWRRDLPAIYGMNCDSSTRSDELVPCLFGSPSAQKTVVLLGDSIGAQWFSMIKRVFDDQTWRVVVLTKSSCPMVDEDYRHVRSGQTYKICSSWRASALAEVERLKPDVVVLGSASTYDFSEGSWIEGSARVFKRISSAASTVIVIAGTPSLAFDGPACLLRTRLPDGELDTEACLSEGRSRLVSPVTSYLNAAAGRYANVHVLELNDLVCGQEDCNAVSEDGLVVFRDTQHLTDSFVISRIPQIRMRLESFIDLSRVK